MDVRITHGICPAILKSLGWKKRDDGLYIRPREGSAQRRGGELSAPRKEE